MGAGITNVLVIGLEMPGGSKYLYLIPTAYCVQASRTKRNRLRAPDVTWIQDYEPLLQELEGDKSTNVILQSLHGNG